MKTFICYLIVCCSIANAQSPSSQFIFPSNSSYGTVLQYHYSQSQWYYKDLVERGYSANDLSNSSQQALDAILQIKPRVDNTKSILDCYKKIYQQPNTGFNIPYP